MLHHRRVQSIIIYTSNTCVVRDVALNWATRSTRAGASRSCNALRTRKVAITLWAPFSFIPHIHTVDVTVFGTLLPTKRGCTYAPRFAFNDKTAKWAKSYSISMAHRAHRAIVSACPVYNIFPIFLYIQYSPISRTNDVLYNNRVVLGLRCVRNIYRCNYSRRL